jgi:hypothetical protein
VTAPWSAPGETAEQPTVPMSSSAPPATATAAQATVPPSGRPPLPPPPVPLRPMTVADLLDGAFAILQRRPRDVLTLAVAFIVPIEVLSAVLLRDLLDTGALGALGDAGSTFPLDDSGAFAGLGATLATLAVGALSLALLAGALTALVDGWYRGKDVPASDAIMTAIRRGPALVVGVVLVHLLEVAGLVALVVGAYVVMALLHLVSPVIVAEGVGPLRAIARSVRLTRRRIGPSLAVPALVGLIGALVGFGFQLVPELLTLVVPADREWLVRAVGQILGQLLVAPFTAGVAVLYHLDLRVRTEGLDIERRAHELFAR